MLALNDQLRTMDGRGSVDRLASIDLEARLEENEGEVQSLLDRANELRDLREIRVSFPEEK